MNNENDTLFIFDCRHVSKFNKFEKKNGCLLCGAEVRRCKCSQCMCHNEGYSHLDNLCSWCADGQHKEIVLMR